MNIVPTKHAEPADPDQALIEHAAALIRNADALVIAAGAGMGVDSGLPDFRGDAGFWKAYPALAEAGTTFTAIAAPAAFWAEPRRAWGFYGHRLTLYRQTVPHRGFEMLRRWGNTMRHGYFVFTSNVDGHFQKAGFDTQRIDECHGSIHHLQCLMPCTESIWPARGVDPVVDPRCCELLGPMPTCPHCGSIARPNILMFDDNGWLGARRDVQAMRRHDWLDRARQPVVVEIGAGVEIATVRHFAHRVVLRHNGALIRINPRNADIGNLRGVGIAAGAAATLTAIDALLAPRAHA